MRLSLPLQITQMRLLSFPPSLATFGLLLGLGHDELLSDDSPLPQLPIQLAS